MVESDVMDRSKGLPELATKIDSTGTRRAFAESIEISESYLSQLLSGHRSISKLPVDKLLKISSLSGFSIERLTGISSQRESTPDRKRAGRR